jgi:hypothetical protein
VSVGVTKIRSGVLKSLDIGCFNFLLIGVFKAGGAAQWEGFIKSNCPSVQSSVNANNYFEFEFSLIIANSC